MAPHMQIQVIYKVSNLPFPLRNKTDEIRVIHPLFLNEQVETITICTEQKVETYLW